MLSVSLFSVRSRVTVKLAQEDRKLLGKCLKTLHNVDVAATRHRVHIGGNIAGDEEQNAFLPLSSRTHFPAKRKRGPGNEQVPLKASIQQTGQTDRQLGRSQGGGEEEEEEKLPTINRQMLTVWGTKGARRRERER